MEEYNVFSDQEFKTDCERDQILYPHLMRVECAWCGEDMSVKPCNAGQQDKISHGMCDLCKIKMEKEISDYGEVK